MKQELESAQPDSLEERRDIDTKTEIINHVIAILSNDDLPAASLAGSNDTYSRFELALPFSRTLITVFLEKVANAEKACGE